MQHAVASFQKIYGGTEEGVRTFFAPGRVNLIGEHIDYNGGNVLPCALEIGTYVVAKKRDDQRIRFYSENFADLGVVEVDLKDLSYDEKHDWANYPKGVFAAIKEEYELPNGVDLYYVGNIPNGAGLSSSASIELATAVMVKELFTLPYETLDLVKLSQAVENRYIGVNCGIMDQFAVGFGKAEHAILLNCQTLEYQYVPFSLGEYKIVIANTNKRRGLADSAYNERRATCEAALAKIQGTIDVKELAHLTEDQLPTVLPLLTEEEQQRVRHVVTENARTLKAMDALTAGDMEQFGQLMKESHLSLRDDYEVSCKELDTLVEAAWEQNGTLGARMTGAGFGGCTVNIVRSADTDKFIEEVGATYKQQIGYEADFYVISVGEGAREIY
ncbi:galactokinase [Mangrovibacillus cuniculi]|uniref:Galactokinase n=1 Tax=Mangrovibacillus cuniculi TaxID=2593652 RepID=A0A7S8C8V0_9BACI|nr:galactokinase [Mangrovibacillus cuniculi]QPC45542.1 galactokinase [Mangrovibacillus cuniculi]